MTPRTPAAIFDEVLDLWDERQAQHLFECYRGLEYEAKLKNHLNEVRAYREEFREAEQARIGLVAGSPLTESKQLRDSIRASAREYERRPAPLTRAQFPRGDGGEPATLDPAAAEQAEREESALIEEHRQRIVDDPVRPEPPAAQVIDLMEALKASLRAAERPDERGERLSERYTKDDGSAK